MKPISLQLYSVRREASEDFVGVLRKVAGFGYAGVEFGSLHGLQPAEFKKLLDDLGMVGSSFHHGVATPDNVNRIVDLAGIIGCQVVVSGWRAEAWETPDGIQEAADAYQAAAELLKPHGLIQAYHNPWWELKDFNGRRGLEIFYDLAPDAHSQLDIYWASRFGEVDVAAFLKAHGDRCSTLHVKDGPLVQGQPHTAVGAGKMDIPAIIRAADDKTLQWLVVELDECATDMLVAVQQSLDYLVAQGLGTGRQ